MHGRRIAMTCNPSPAPRQRLARRELVALCALLTFGCTVVRAPASAIAPRIPVRDGVAEPQLELWLESGGPVGPAESEAAAATARRALYEALAPRRLEDGDQLLVVRAQGVSRTPSRRDNQSAAVAGIVVGVVVVAVVAIVASKGSGGHGGKAPAGGRVASRSGGPRVAAAPPRPPRLGAPRVFPHHHHGRGPAWGVNLGVHVVVPLVPPPPPPVAAEAWYETPPPPEPVPPLAPAEPAPASPADSPADSPAEPPPEAPLAELMLPPLPAMDLESRGFFAGDAVKAELLLVDRKSGAPLWMKVVESEADPLDAAKVKELLDGALDDPRGWVPAGPPPPPPPAP